MLPDRPVPDTVADNTGCMCHHNLAPDRARIESVEVMPVPCSNVVDRVMYGPWPVTESRLAACSPAAQPEEDVERVARALWAAEFKKPMEVLRDEPPNDEDQNPGWWVEDVWESMLDTARTAVATLRLVVPPAGLSREEARRLEDVLEALDVDERPWSANEREALDVLSRLAGGDPE